MKKSDLKWPLFLLCSRAEELHVFQLFCEMEKRCRADGKLLTTGRKQQDGAGKFNSCSK